MNPLAPPRTCSAHADVLHCLTCTTAAPALPVTVCLSLLSQGQLLGVLVNALRLVEVWHRLCKLCTFGVLCGLLVIQGCGIPVESVPSTVGMVYAGVIKCFSIRACRQ